MHRTACSERPRGLWPRMVAGIAKMFEKAAPCHADFAPGLLRIQNAPPSPLSHITLKTLALMLVALLVWSALGRLDIVAVAEGRLVPHSFLKIVQPAEAGIVKEILVKEGERVSADQVLMRMDSIESEADIISLETESQRKAMSLRRIDAELSDGSFSIALDDPAPLFVEIQAQFIANKMALAASLEEEASRLEQARKQLLAAMEVESKIKGALPFYLTQENAFQSMASKGYVGGLEAKDKSRERLEKEHELRSQQHLIRSAQAAVAESIKKIAQIRAEYSRNLHVERNEVQGQLDKLAQELTKQHHRRELLELRSPVAGVVKDLATHTPGTVTQPGTVLITMVPLDEKLNAEVWVTNQDRGFVRPGQPVRVKLVAFPFQKYGMVQGTVETVSADSSDIAAAGTQPQPLKSVVDSQSGYKTLVALDSMTIDVDGQPQPLAVGLQVSAEIIIGQRTVLEYLLSPVRKVINEAGRER